MTFFRSLFHKDGRTAEPKVPAGYRIYAIGDVHGRLDLLDHILGRIAEDIEGRKRSQNIIVFLGDLIDRGPSSAQVLERVRTFRSEGVRLVVLSGNHEEVLLRLLRGENGLLSNWLRFGGAECAKSYGVDVAELKRMEPSRAIDLLREKIAPEHVAFLKTFVDTFRIGDYLFVHAGLRPGIPLAEQSQADLRWIREPFLNHRDSHGFVVVHGHTIRDEVDVRDNRIGLDTGAYRSGVLTAMGLEGGERWFLQSRPGDSASEAPRATGSHPLPGLVTAPEMTAFPKGALQ